MKIRYNVIFIPLLIIIAFTVWYMGFREKRQTAAKRLSDRSLVEMDQLDIIEIVKPDLTIRLEKIGTEGGEGAGTAEDWKMVQPYEAGCDPAALAALIDGIMNASSERDLTDVTQKQRAEYGLDNPDMRIRLASTEGSVMMDLLIGRVNPSGSSRYGGFEGEATKAFLVPIYEVEPFDVAPEDLRDLRAVSFDPETLVSIQLSSAAADINIQKQEGIWMVTSPKQFAASTARLEILFQNLRELLATEFLSTEADNPELKTDTADVVLTDQDGKVTTLTLHGEDVTKGYYATSSWQPTPFIVQAYIYDRLALDPMVFFHVLLIDFAPEQIARVLVRQPGAQNLEIGRRGTGPEDFEILTPEDRSYTDPGDFTSFMDALLALQPKENVDLPSSPEEYGLEPVYFLKVEVFREREMGEAVIYIGRQNADGDYYATQDGMAYFTIRGEQIARFIGATDKLRGTMEE